MRPILRRYRRTEPGRNRAGRAEAIAEQRGQAAQQLAAAQGKRLDRALERVAGATATTCADAMPTVDAVLKSVR